MIVSMNAKKERPTGAKKNQTKPNQINEKKAEPREKITQYVYVHIGYI